jgi:hypothetical protein
VNTYTPVKYQIVDYTPVIDNFSLRINEYNSKNTQYDELISRGDINGIIRNQPDDLWGRNFWGQFIATGGITNLVGDLTGKYDVVIKTRSDTVFNILSEDEWIHCFKIMCNHHNDDTTMFTPWIRIQRGVSDICDIAFMSKPEAFYQFSKNIYSNCVDIATKDKALFYELVVADHIYISHWLWNKISNYSRSNWLSFTNLGPNHFAATVLRESQDVQSVTYSFLEQVERDYHMRKQIVVGYTSEGDPILKGLGPITKIK